MPKLTDWKEEEFCRMVACGASQSDAYREVFRSDAMTTSVWSMASRLYAKVASRVTELRELLRGASEQEWIMGKVELMQYLTRALRTPGDAIGPDSDLVQEIKVIESESGSITQTKAVNRLGAATLLANVANYTTPAISQLHLHNHNAAPTAKLEDAAASMAAKYRLPEPLPTILDAEIVEPTSVKQTKRHKTV